DGFDAKGRYGPSITALTASNIAICTMVMRTCVRSAFSPTWVPSDVNRVPHSSRTAGPVRALADGIAALLLGIHFGPAVMTSRTATIANAAELQNLSFMTAPFWILYC